MPTGRKGIWPECERVKISVPGGRQTLSSCGSVTATNMNKRIDTLYKMYMSEKENHRETKKALDKAIDLAV